MGNLKIEELRLPQEMPIPVSAPYLHPQGLSTDSSIAPASPIAPSFAISKPKLKGPLELQLIETHNDVTRVSKKAMKANAKQIDRHNVEFEEITNRHIEALQKSAQAAQSQQSWSYLQQLGGVILGVANISLGAYLLTQDSGSDTAGKLLIGAGVAALSSAAIDKLLHDPSGEPSGFLPMAAPIFLAMVSLALSMIAARYNTNIEIKDLLDTLQGGITGLIALSKPYLEYLKTRSDLGLLSVQKDLFLKEESIKNLFQMIETLLKEFDRITRAVKKTTRLTINQNIPA
ncbi:MAG: hypothetical protein JSR58_07885 [Verrucomicrobia bacterium]|nr:hypothetical protein [Verrucomicrobiota bacterium]